jgi:hypothetical protein
MPTYLTFTIDDLDAEIQALDSKWLNRSDFATLRERAYKRAIGEYQEELISNDDIFIRSNTFGLPIAIGTAKVDTAGADIFVVDLPADALQVAGDSILVSKDTTANFLNVPRMTWADIVASGVDQTDCAFWEDNGQIVIYSKDGTIVDTDVVHAPYYRRLDVTQTPTTTDLDIKTKDFDEIIDSTKSFMDSYA